MTMKLKLPDRCGRGSLQGFFALLCFLLLSVSGTQAQTAYEVTGIVSNHTSPPTPLAGASVVEKGTSQESSLHRTEVTQSGFHRPMPC